MNAPVIRNEPKGLIFDLDDTLYLQADYKRSGFRAVAEWLEQHKGLDSDTAYHELDIILQTKGPSYPNMFDIFVKNTGFDPKLTKTLVEVFIEHQPQINCFPGVIKMISRLRNHYKLGILTDGRLKTQEKKIDALRLRDKVDAILCSDIMGTNKPDEQLYCWFETYFMLKPTEQVYIADNPHKDFFGANKRGWLTVRVLTGEHARTHVNGMWKAKRELPHVTELEVEMQKKNKNNSFTVTNS